MAKLKQTSGIDHFSIGYFATSMRRVLEGQKDISFRYYMRGGRCKIKCYGYCPDREIKTAMLLSAAFEKVHYDLKGDVHMNISCHDYCRVRRRHIYAYCRKKGNSNIELIPDYFFVNNREWTKYDDYDSLVKEMLAASEKSWQYDNLFWIGAISKKPVRENLYKISKCDKRLKILATDRDLDRGEKPFVSLVDHVKYKYLLDMAGNSWSDRRKVLLFSGRPLFIVGDEWEEYALTDLVPFKHYIPVKKDFSDLIDKLDWADSNPEAVMKIAEQAKQFALNRLTRERAVSDLSEIILKAQKGKRK